MLSAVATVPSGSVEDVAWQSSSCGASTQERLLALVIFTQASRREAAEGDINLSFEEISKLREEVKQAIEQAREAERDSGLWGDLADLFGGDLATIAGAIAAVAAVVATGGSAAAVLAVVASAASFAAEHAEELGIPAEVAMGIAIAASIAGLACGNGKGLIDVSKSVADVAGDVKVYALAAQGIAEGAGGGSRLRAGLYEASAMHYRADARQGEGQQEMITSDIDEALALMHSSLEQQLAMARVTSSITERENASSATILDNFAGAA